MRLAATRSSRSADAAGPADAGVDCAAARRTSPSAARAAVPAVTKSRRFIGCSPTAVLLHVLHVAVISLVVTDEERLKRGGELLFVEVALLVRLYVRRAFPQAHREPGVLVIRVLHQPPPPQPLDLTPLRGHRGLIRFLELVP